MRPSEPAREMLAIEKAAADWIARCDRGLTPAEAEEFARWENADPRHLAEFARLSSAWDAFNTADEVPKIMRLAQALDTRSRFRHFLRRHSRTLTGLGIAAALALVAATSLRNSPPPQSAPSGAGVTYRVIPGMAQRLILADGTLVELNGDSAVKPFFTPGQRIVRLVRGEARFNVTKDPSRPFVVQAAGVAVQAVGTVFNVRLDPGAVEVLVTEGKVRVDDMNAGTSLLAPKAETPGPSVLGAGERVAIAIDSLAPAAPVAVNAADLERATGWQATQLVFERTPLAEAVAAFNSFNQRQLVIGDTALGGRKLGGSFRADNLDAFVRLLETGFDIKAETGADREIVLRSAR